MITKEQTEMDLLSEKLNQSNTQDQAAIQILSKQVQSENLRG